MPYVGIGSQQNSQKLLGEKMGKAYAALLAGLLVCFVVVALGRMQSQHFVPLPRIETVQEVQQEAGEMLLNSIKGENIAANLRLLTKEPHQAGTKANDRVAKTIEDLYKSAGLQKVHTTTYDVLLSYPDWDKLNTIAITDRSGALLFRSKGVSPVLVPDEQSAPHAGHEWVAYSAPGRVDGEIVYCNFGRPADFENLKKMGIDVRGKIALLRYGEGFRGDKVHEAQHNGAVGAILFSDPGEVAIGAAREGVYPNSIWMPPEGTQRGSIMKLNGDPLTPLYPAKIGAYKSKTIEEAKADGVLPNIPVLPISYSTAYQLLSRMQGRPVPVSWQGNINVTVGPGLTNGQRTTIDVKSELVTKHIHNVVGYIPGADEDDRYVILGNHFDAWVYGSIDPNSGTAILAEVARAMQETINETSWRPARSIMFAAWDAEEYGLLGSTEFVEEFVTQLSTRAVAYLNMDCFQGNYSLRLNTIPSLYDISVEVAKRIPNPMEDQVHLGRKTLYDTWMRSFPGRPGTGLPDMPVPSGGSDHAGFLTYAGVPVVDFSYKNQTTRDTYPLYHSLYETPFVNEHLYDSNNLAVHRALGQYWAELARSLSDSPVLPLNVSRFADEIANNYVVDLKKELLKLAPANYLSDAKQTVTMLERVANKLTVMAGQFETHKGKVEDGLDHNPFDQRALRGVNERLMMVDRCFINPRGAPGAAHSRHVLFSVSEKDSYSSRVMAAVYDSYSSSSDKKASGRVVAEQISIIYHSVNCAIATLRHFI